MVTFPKNECFESISVSQTHLALFALNYELMFYAVYTVLYYIHVHVYINNVLIVVAVEYFAICCFFNFC